jgi:hypothetical protein
MYGLEITPCHYKCLLQEYVMLCYGYPTRAPLACSAKVSPATTPLKPCGSQTKYRVIPYSTEQNTQPIVFLISKQLIPYRTCGSTCCPGCLLLRFGPKQIWATTSPDWLNHLHWTNPCLNRNIEPHHGQLTSRQIEDHNSHTKYQAIINIIKDVRLVR